MVKIRHLRQGSKPNTIDVHTTGGIILDVSENIVRCAFGSDFDYLMEHENERFNVNQSDFEDFFKFSESFNIKFPFKNVDELAQDAEDFRQTIQGQLDGWLP